MEYSEDVLRLNPHIGSKPRKAQKRPAGQGSSLERRFDTLWQRFAPPSMPAPLREFRFAPPRRWRADFAFCAERVLVECEGGVWTNGRHVRGSGYNADLEKYNAAQADGFVVLRFTSDMLRDDPEGCIALVVDVLEQRQRQQARQRAAQAALGVGDKAGA